MKRRGFLKGLLSTPAIAAVPTIAKNLIKEPEKTEAEKIDEMEIKTGEAEVIKIDEQELGEYILADRILYKKVE